VVLQLGGLDDGLTTAHCENESLLRNIYIQNLELGLILWYDLSNEIILGWIFMKWNVELWFGLGWLRIETGGEQM
jgi:hypothetical protein